ncbi:MAG: class Ib ribonucleoside-diphosphate reductase assembly flavoprotein NrdI [Corynebacterium sp.]|uniref:class Ib ribonucleoside-diphosphate reductase assembly flavoprotein NrdI n=1 Tax=Corynebacterium sp. TaxID=1720 RepID=UPI003F9737EE
MFIVYFSSTTRNTDRFVQKLDMPNARIPLRRGDEPLRVDVPFVLVCPTYGGGASITGDESRPVPKQVVRFLNDAGNRANLRGVIASGNLNFGEDFCRAGDVISAKCQVPYLYRFELMGTPHDVDRVREGLTEFEEALRREGRWESREGAA